MKPKTMQTKDGFRVIGWQSMKGSIGGLIETIWLIKGFDHNTRCTLNVYSDGTSVTLPF